ncbi:YhfC family intramembrane metalloprotease [Corynebacterium hindlerae]|uniref:YhfC family intramembrane metalloprotease n=1 Tax=Corynebacterium hindlerae TaxID=699041 RepID=A0A7G5FCI6_9CORY|nr:YhfC family glutamic-type intramembrane protease [Corynebacterium hindlerae]QMV84327.1 YhfC family intramembrane metalloprotease [Corynebacterium hindlerae]
MVSTTAIACMVATLLLCIAIPVGGIVAVARRNKQVMLPFAVGMLAFFVSQVVLRMPLMSLLAGLAPDPVGKFVSSIPVASFSAGLFEETARMVFMLLLLKGLHRLVDGVAFGLGHGGIEALLLVGMTMFFNLAMSFMINMDKWDVVAKSLPPEAAEQMRTALTQTPATEFLVGGVERIWAIGLHIMCSLIIMMGVEKQKRALAWVVAVLVHGFTNLAVLGAIQQGANVWLVEAAGLVVIAALLTAVVRYARRVLPAGLPTPR